MDDGGGESPYRKFALAVVGLLVVTVIALAGRLLRAIARLRLPCSPRVLGALLVLLVVVLWTASSVAMQHFVFESDHYEKPYFVTYFSMAMLNVYLPFYPQRTAKLWDALCGRCNKYEFVRDASGDTSRLGDESLRAVPLGPLAELAVGARVGLLFFASQLCFILGLEMSTVSSVTLIASSSSLWTLLFSVLFLRERVGPVKLLATILSFCGVLVVVRYGGGGARHAAGSSSGGSSGGSGGGSGAGAYGLRMLQGGGVGVGAYGSRPLQGNAISLVSAVLYGGYAAQLKRELPDESALPMPYLFGLIGLSTSVITAVGLPLLHLLRWELFALPSSSTMLALALNASLGTVLSNMLLAKVMPGGPLTTSDCL